MTIIDAVGEKLDQSAPIVKIQADNPALLGVLCSWKIPDADRKNLTALRRAFPRPPLISDPHPARGDRRPAFWHPPAPLSLL
ncbi:MAG TPA: hypothetical protein G4N94_13980 [Caldilineae bacterium]|nr:hypothetical protein [Caldilineae bacterium]